MQTEKIIVDVQFKSKNGNHLVKLRALRNGVLLIDKTRYESTDEKELFNLAYVFINQYKADKVSLKRGVIEDQFAKHIKEADSEKVEEVKVAKEEVVEGDVDAELVVDEPLITEVEYLSPVEPEEVEGVKLELVEDEEDKGLLADLALYKEKILESVRYADYTTMLYQGIVYTEARKEIIESTGQDVNPFDLTISLPSDEKETILAEIEKVNEALLETNSEEIVVKKYKNRIEIKQTDYKLSIDFK